MCNLVQQPGLQILPHDVRSAPDTDVLVAGGGTGQLECGLDPISHEGVGRTSLHGQGLSLFVGLPRGQRYPSAEAKFKYSIEKLTMLWHCA